MVENKIIRGFVTMLSVVAFFGIAGCEEEGPAEKAGKKIDNAAEELKKTLEK